MERTISNGEIRNAFARLAKIEDLELGEGWKIFLSLRISDLWLLPLKLKAVVMGTPPLQIQTTIHLKVKLRLHPKIREVLFDDVQAPEGPPPIRSLDHLRLPNLRPLPPLETMEMLNRQIQLNLKMLPRLREFRTANVLLVVHSLILQRLGGLQMNAEDVKDITRSLKRIGRVENLLRKWSRLGGVKESRGKGRRRLQILNRKRTSRSKGKGKGKVEILVLDPER